MTVLFDYWRSSAAYRVRIALNLKQVDHRSVSVNLIEGEHRSPEHLAINPQGLVPALELDGRVMTQSLAIIEYLEETRPVPALLPSDSHGRQRVRALAYAIAMDIHPLTNMSMSRYGSSLTGEVNALEKWMHRFMVPGLSAFEALLADGPGGRYCHRDEVSLADLCLVPQIYNARRWKVALDAFPRIVDICDALGSIPEIAAAHPDKVKPS